MLAVGTPGGVSHPDERMKFGYPAAISSSAVEAPYTCSGVPILKTDTGSTLPITSVSDGQSRNAAAMSMPFPKW